MHQWDERAMSWLTDQAEVLHQLGVVELVRDHVRAAWVRRIEDHDPSLGDTRRLLGVGQSENVRERVLRAYRDDRMSWAAKGVKVTDPQQSLLITVTDDLLVHPAKSRINRQQEPLWSRWQWAKTSAIRLDASRDNRVGYAPDRSDGQMAFPGMVSRQSGDPNKLRHLVIAYAGDLDTGRTAGWAAIPSAVADDQEPEEPWMAVVRLWWDDDSADGQSVRPDTSTPTDHQPFDARPAPGAAVSIKPTRRGPQRK